MLAAFDFVRPLIDVFYLKKINSLLAANDYYSKQRKRGASVYYSNTWK